MPILFDLALAGVFVVTLMVCYKRGLLRTGLTTLKLLLSLGGTYYTQDLLRPLVDSWLPSGLQGKVAAMGTYLPTNLFDEYLQVFIGNLFTSVLIFAGYYLILSLLLGILVGALESFFLTKVINKLGGLAIGVVLGALATVVVAYIIAIVLLFNNSTTGIGIIYDTQLLKIIVADNVKFILDNLVK